MPKMTDQEFDSLFREAANRLNPQPPAEDWNDMQSRLEMAERDARARNISLYSMVVLLLLYSFLMPDTLKVRGVERAAVLPNITQEQPQSLTKESQRTEATTETISPSQAAKSQAQTSDDATKVEASPEAGATRKVEGSEEAAASQEAKASGAKTLQGVNASQQKTAASQIATGSGGAAKTISSDVKRDAVKTQSGGLQPAKNSTASTNAATVALIAASANPDANNGTNRDDVAKSAQVQGSERAASAGNADATILADGHSDLPNGQTLGTENKRLAKGSVVAAGVATTIDQPVRSDGANKSLAGSVANKDIQQEGITPQVAGSVSTANPAAGTAWQPTATANRQAIGGFNWMDESLATPSTVPLDGQVETSPSTVALDAPGTVVSPQIRVSHPWFVKMALSPDFSSINYGGTSKPGINFGPLVEYGLSSRFSITTGAIWSKKIYSQANPDKTYSRGSSTIKADMLDADCRIIDIPLNVTYYFRPGRKTNFFVTVGSSSYVMLDEKYVYTVYSAYRNYEYKEAYSNKNVEWFSMLNLSVGIQHQIGRRWFIQGEPFLKAPIKGVGQGKVDLASTGAFISLKYLINP